MSCRGNILPRQISCTPSTRFRKISCIPSTRFWSRHAQKVRADNRGLVAKPGPKTPPHRGRQTHWQDLHRRGGRPSPCRQRIRKLDFQTDLDLIAPLFDGPTSDVDAIMSRVADYKRVRLSKETAFVLFDEVQLCERALNSLRFFSGSGWRICGTGSQLGVATRRRRLPFPSGARQETMHPMTFEEFLWAMGEGQMADSIRSHALSLEPYPAHQEALRPVSPLPGCRRHARRRGRVCRALAKR
ncbi:MAG: AAA family ATPase [Parafannyhessea sp.]|uniref:AAA family ATPase n=1 Tax=Parafannyhessea sp. TaxID=2847324 RepID=UPI003EFF52DE